MTGLEQPIDVDELAREKVQEAEKLLDSSENFSLESLDSWLSILKQIITAADLHRTNDKNIDREHPEAKSDVGESIYADYADDNEQFNAVDLSEQFASNSVKWTIRVKAFKIVHRLVHLFNSPGKSASSKTPILKYLPDLVRLSFVAATSPYDDLKLQGFEMFKFLINRFATVEEKEFPGHSILEQYRTQVLSALKPAFNSDAPPYITAIASQVCCLWICRGLEQDSNNLKRTYQLMLGTIDKLEHQSINQNSKLYTESELEQERLDILGSWAQLYLTAEECNETSFNESPIKTSSPTKTIPKQLKELVKPQIESLVDKWWEALKDYALLIMPASKIMGTLHDNEHVYTREVALRLFAPVWSKLILASTIRLCSETSVNGNLTRQNSENNTISSKDTNQNCDSPCKNQYATSKTKYLKFICGIIMKELCKCLSECKNRAGLLSEPTLLSLRSLFYLVNNDEFRSNLIENLETLQEFHTVLYGISSSPNRIKSPPQNLILRNLLDSIFFLFVTKISTDQNKVEFGVISLIEAITNDLDHMKSKKEELEIIKSNLYIRLNRLMNIIKLAPDLATGQLHLQERIIDIFQSLISYEAHPTVGVHVMDSLNGLYDSMPRDFRSSFVNRLCVTELNSASKLLNSMNLVKLNENEKSLNFSRLEVYLKSVRSSLKMVELNDRHSLMTTYIETLIGLSKNMTGKAIESISDCDKELLVLAMKHVQELKVTYPVEYDEIMNLEKRQALGEALKLQQDISNGNQVKSEALTAKKQASFGPQTKPQAKIILKADFSNFYAKKS